MPIYDNDGTANREIAKVYDNNGSANAAIKEVYDNDGSANRLIWQDTLYLVGAPGNNSAKWSSGDYAYNWLGDPVLCCGVWSASAAGFQTLHIDFNGTYLFYTNPDDPEKYVNSLVRVGYSRTQVKAGTTYPKSTFTARQEGNGTRRTVTFNISAENGTIYVWVGQTVGGGGITVTGTVYNIWLD